MEVSCAWLDEKDRQLFCVNMDPSVVFYHETLKEFSRAFLCSLIEPDTVSTILICLKDFIPNFKWKCNVTYNDIVRAEKEHFELNVFGDSDDKVFILKIFIEDFKITKINSQLMLHAHRHA